MEGKQLGKYFVGVDVGGTNIKCGVFTDKGDLLANLSYKLTSLDSEYVVNSIATLVNEVIAISTVSMEDVVAIGLVLPGLLDVENGIAVAVANFPSFKEYPLVSSVQKLIPKPIYLENDARAAVAAELWVGSCGAGVSTIAMFTLGTGVGCGIIINGLVLHGGRGFSGYAPEAGHMIVEPKGRPCGCGQNGCLEQYASATAVVKTAFEFLSSTSHDGSSYLVKFGTSLTCKDVMDCAKEGDEVALKVVEYTAGYVAVGCVNISRIFEPEAIILTGGMTEAGDMFFDLVQREYEKVHWTISKPRKIIQKASVGNHAGITGAAYIAKCGRH